MAWKSTRELVTELGLKADPNDVDQVKNAIKAEIALVHPDKNGGEYASEEAHTRCTTLTSALGWLESQAAANQLVPMSQVKDIMVEIAKAIAPSQGKQISDIRRDFREEERNVRSSRYFLPKIGSGVVATICTVLFVASGSLKDHPAFTPEAIKQLSSACIFLGVMAAMVCALTWIIERQDERRTEWLSSDQGGRSLFRDFVDRLMRRRDRDDLIIRQSDFVRFISGPASRNTSPLTRPFTSMLFSNEAMAEKIAKMHLAEFEARGAIEKLEGRGLDVRYKVHPEILDELRIEDDDLGL